MDFFDNPFFDDPKMFPFFKIILSYLVECISSNKSLFLYFLLYNTRVGHQNIVFEFQYFLKLGQLWTNDQSKKIILKMV